MLDPAWTAGRVISPKPACGPDDSSRKSLQILEIFAAIRFRTLDSWTSPPTSWLGHPVPARDTDPLADRAQQAAFLRVRKILRGQRLRPAQDYQVISGEVFFEPERILNFLDLEVKCSNPVAQEAT